MIVAPERLTPGIIDTHCARPTPITFAERQVGDRRCRGRAWPPSRSRGWRCHPRSAPSRPSSALPSSASIVILEHHLPSTAEGSTPTRMLRMKRSAASDRAGTGRSGRSRRSPSRATTTARIAPSWITTLNSAHCVRVVAEQFGGEDQMPGRGDRDEFGQALDDAEQDCGEDRVHRAVMATGRAQVKHHPPRLSPEITRCARAFRAAGTARRPGWTLNALYHSSTLRTGPLTRNSAGECGSVSICWRSALGPDRLAPHLRPGEEEALVAGQPVDHLVLLAAERDLVGAVGEAEAREVADVLAQRQPPVDAGLAFVERAERIVLRGQRIAALVESLAVGVGPPVLEGAGRDRISIPDRRSRGPFRGRSRRRSRRN